MIGYQTPVGILSDGINHFGYGLERYYYPFVDETYLKGAAWSKLTDTGIRVYRDFDDSYWQQVRVMLWKIPEP